MTSATSHTSVSIQNLLVPIPTGIGLSAFSLPSQPCYLQVSITAHLDPSAISQSAVQDDLPNGNSVNYSELGKKITKVLTSGEREGLKSLEEATERVISVCSEDYGDAIKTLDVVLERPKGLLFARSVSVDKRVSWSDGRDGGKESNVESYGLTIHDIELMTVIGLNPHERLEEQKLRTDVRVDLQKLQTELSDYHTSGFDYKSFALEAYDFLSSSSFQTLETLLYRILEKLLTRIPISSAVPCTRTSTSAGSVDNNLPSPQFSNSRDIKLTISVSKPSAIAFADCPVVSATRCLRDFNNDTSSTPILPQSQAITRIPEEATSNTPRSVTAYIAVGTNLGDRIGNLNRAVDELCAEDEGIKLVKTSRLYESEPMYVLDQGKFINGAIEVSLLFCLIILFHASPRCVIGSVC